MKEVPNWIWVLIAGAFTHNAMAGYLYEYTGNPFDPNNPAALEDARIPGSYTASNSINGFFETEFKLPSNQPTFDIMPLVTNFSFGDGRRTISGSPFEPWSAISLFAATGALGEIVLWRILIIEPASPLPLQVGDGGYAIETSNSNGFVRDRGFIALCTVVNLNGLCREAATENGLNENSPGLWTGPIRVPEPTTVALMALGIAGLGYSCRKA